MYLFNIYESDIHSVLHREVNMHIVVHLMFYNYQYIFQKSIPYLYLTIVVLIYTNIYWRYVYEY